MGAWDLYNAKMRVRGEHKRDMVINHAKESITRRLVDSASRHEVEIDGIPQTVAVINKSDLKMKKICSVPGEHLRHGGIVEFSDCKWLITELDANNEVYDRGLMKQCNHVLRWINGNGELIEKWCVVEDGTKLMRMKVRNSLAYRKRYAKSNPLIAGIP